MTRKLVAAHTYDPTTEGSNTLATAAKKTTARKTTARSTKKTTARSTNGRGVKTGAALKKELAAVKASALKSKAAKNAERAARSGRTSTPRVAVDPQKHIVAKLTEALTAAKAKKYRTVRSCIDSARRVAMQQPEYAKEKKAS